MVVYIYICKELICCLISHDTTLQSIRQSVLEVIITIKPLSYVTYVAIQGCCGRDRLVLLTTCYGQILCERETNYKILLNFCVEEEYVEVKEAL